VIIGDILAVSSQQSAVSSQQSAVSNQQSAIGALGIGNQPSAIGEARTADCQQQAAD
jgi:hypothetical protein